MATTALGLACGTKGSVARFSGMAAAPLGLPRALGSSLNSNLGLAFTEAVDPELSSAPPSIHLRIRSISESGILAALGGILGSSLWVITPRIELPSASPGSITLPDPPPRRAALKLSRFKPPLALSGLWQVPHRAR